MTQRNIIILAAHDDGVGAHTSMCRIRNGILEFLNKHEYAEKFFFLYLNKGASGKAFLLDYWNRGNPTQWGTSKTPIDPSNFPKYQGIWQEAENFLTFEKSSDGTLDAPHTRKLIRKTKLGFPFWGHHLEKVDPKAVAFTVEMGVPQLSEWASMNDISCFAVTDMLWSRTLMGSLKGAGEYDNETEKFVHDLISKERQIKEAWLIPLLAPRSYTEFLAEMQVIYHWLPGFLGNRPDSDEIEKARNLLGVAGNQRLIVMAAGQTRVWKSLYEKLANVFKQRPNSDITLAYPDDNDLVLIEQGQERRVSSPPSLLATFATAKLGVTRGGVTITEFIAANLPFAVVQEPNHWLSQNQQAAASEEGLCYTAGLSIFSDANEAADLLEEWARDDSNHKLMKNRYMMYNFGIENKLGEHLVRRFLL